MWPTFTKLLAFGILRSANSILAYHDFCHAFDYRLTVASTLWQALLLYYFTLFWFNALKLKKISVVYRSKFLLLHKCTAPHMVCSSTRLINDHWSMYHWIMLSQRTAQSRDLVSYEKVLNLDPEQVWFCLGKTLKTTIKRKSFTGATLMQTYFSVFCRILESCKKRPPFDTNSLLIKMRKAEPPDWGNLSDAR